MKFSDILDDVKKPKAEEQITEGKSETAEIHLSNSGNSAMGDMIVIDGVGVVTTLAKMLGIPDGWKKPVKVGECWASFSSGDRLVFFADDDDYVADDE